MKMVLEFYDSGKIKSVVAIGIFHQLKTFVKLLAMSPLLDSLSDDDRKKLIRTIK